MAGLFGAEEHRIGPWNHQVLVFEGYSNVLAVPVRARIGNSITTSPTGKNHTAKWKLAVGDSVRAVRGPEPWMPRDRYVITLGFSFHCPSHGNQPLDVENFIKPTLDALAAGLFSPTDTDLTTLVRWGYDDSNFTHFFIHRLPDALTQDEEGAALFICDRTVGA